MRYRTSVLRRAPLNAAALLVLLLAPAAKAADEQDPFADAKPPPESARRPNQELVPAKPTEPEEPPPVGPVERLPPTAYPAWTPRGLVGGSLWLSGNMHGMPWPYYPKTGIGVSGYAWLDTGYETIDRGNNANQPDLKQLVNQGRAVLRVTPTYSGDSFYVQGQAELVGNKDQTQVQPQVADLDDLWIRVGQWKKWDVQIGRFEAFEVYHFGMGMDLNTLERKGADDQIRTPPDVYGLTSIVYRQSGVGNVALHGYLGDYIRGELLGQFGFDVSPPLNTTGVRGTVVVDLGKVKAKLAGDLRKQFAYVSTSKESRFQRGVSAALQLVLDPWVELGVNAAAGLTDHYNPINTTDPNASMGDFDGANSFTDVDGGAFLNFRLAADLLAGTGVNYNHQTDQVTGSFNHLQTFAAIQYFLGKRLLIKVVGSYAKSHIGAALQTPWDDTMFSGRLRIMYLF